MEQSNLLRVFGFALITLTCSGLINAQAGDPEAIQQKLNTMFTPTTTTADRTDIVTAGSVVVIHKEGMLMYSVASPLPPLSTYKNGKIVQGIGGFGRNIAITFRTPDGNTSASYPQRRFVLDEKCWLTGVSVEKDSIVLELYSDRYDDTRYYGNLKIPFPNKRVVPTVDEAVTLVSEVVTAAPADIQAAQQTTAQKPPAPTAPAATPQPPVPEVAPPPPPDTPPATQPANAPPPTIVVGLTEDEVISAIGQPLKIAKIGVKTIYYYKDMKITFTDGFVSNIQ
jgi:hypothetical protein